MPRLNFYRFERSLNAQRTEGPVRVGPYSFRPHQVVYTKRLFWRPIGKMRRTMDGITERWEGREIKLKVRRAGWNATCTECEAFIAKETLCGSGQKSLKKKVLRYFYYCLNCVVPASAKLGPMRLQEPPKGWNYYAQDNNLLQDL